MKKRHLAFLVIALVALILFTWRWTRNHSQAELPRPTVADAAPDNAAPEASKTQSGVSPAALPPTSPLPTKGEQMISILDAHNDKDIEFYGKVIDQQGSVIPDVKVTGSVIFNNGRGSGVQEERTTTDAQGLFSFSGMKGRTFDYHLEKIGYETMPDRDAFDYTELVPKEKRHHPDPKNPVVLKMWKLHGAEPLVHFYDKSFPLPADGSPVRIDLSTGKQVPAGGDIIFRINHAVLPRGAVPDIHFNWHARIDVIEGGFIESNQRLMYLAPETDYAPTQTIDMLAEKAGWDHTVDRNFYVKIRGSLFARLQMHLNANQRGYDPSHVTLRWWLNPKAGSRNLEFDPAKEQTNQVTP